MANCLIEKKRRCVCHWHWKWKFDRSRPLRRASDQPCVCVCVCVCVGSQIGIVCVTVVTLEEEGGDWRGEEEGDVGVAVVAMEEIVDVVVAVAAAVIEV